MLGRAKKIIVDIDVANCKIRASRPDNQSIKMPNDDIGKIIFFNTMDSNRLNKRTFGTLKGKGLKEAAEIIHKHGNINTPGIYGSISINQSDFIPSTEGK